MNAAAERVVMIRELSHIAAMVTMLLNDLPKRDLEMPGQIVDGMDAALKIVRLAIENRIGLVREAGNPWMT